MRKRIWSRLLALLLTMMMVAGSLPLTVFAAEGDTAYTPDDAVQAGYDVHYFVKADGKGWTLSETAATVAIVAGDGSGAAVTGALAENTAYQIHYNGVYLYAPFTSGVPDGKKSTAQGSTGSNFTFVAGMDGKWKIRAGDNSFMTQNELDFNHSTGAFQGVEFSDAGAEFYITPAAEPNDGSYYIWWSTESDKTIAFHSPEDCRENYEPVYFTKYGGTDGNGWTFDTAQANAAMTFTVDGQDAAFLDTDTKFKISFSGKYLAAPFTNAGLGATDSTAQGNSSDSLFKLVPGENGGYLLQAVGTDKYMTNEAADFSNWKGVRFAASGTEFFIAPVNGSASDGQYYIWYEREKTTEPENPTPPVEEDIGHHQPAEGMTQYYLDCGIPWMSVSEPSALELYNVVPADGAVGAYTRDTDGTINSGLYGIYDPTTADNQGRWMHVSNDSINYCRSQSQSSAHADNAHHFVFTYVAEEKGYIIQSVNTSKYLCGNVRGGLSMGDKGTIFYIDPVEGSAGSYCIWWEAAPQTGDAIAGMFNTNGADNADNTWVFTGGRAMQGSFEDIGLARTMAGQFEEYIRWEKRGNANDESNNPNGMQRYVTDIAYEGQTLANIVSEDGWTRVTALDPRAAVYMVGIEDLTNAGSFQTDLTSFITKSLALRENNGFAVVIKGSGSGLSALNDTVDTAVSGLTAEQKSRVLVVDGSTLTAGQLTEDGYPNAKGHLELAKRLAEAAVGSTANFPGARNDAAAIADGRWANKLTSEGVTIPGRQPETLSAAQQAVRARVEDKSTPMTWLFMGDSITHGALWAEGDGTISQNFEKFVKDDLGRASDVVINTAVSGATSVTTVREIEARLNKYSPDVVSIMIGTNDAAGHRFTGEYKDNIKTILNAIWAKGAIAVLRTPIPDAAGNRGEYIYDYVNMLKEVYNELTDEQKAQTILVDQFAQWSPYLMTADNSTGRTFLFDKVFTQDGSGIHPGPVGHLWMTQELIDGLGLWDSSKNLCKLSYKQDWGITSEESTVSLADAYTYNKDSRTISVPLSGLSLAGNVISAELTVTAGKETYTASYQRGQQDTLSVTLPEGVESVQISVTALTGAGKKVSFASVEADLSSSVYSKLSPPDDLTVYEYHKTSGEFTEGTYAIAGTHVNSGDNGRIRVMHAHVVSGTPTINHCQINANDTPGGDLLTIDHDEHLFNVVGSGNGFTFQVAMGDAAGKYLAGNGDTLLLSDSPCVFTVTALEDGGYSIRWADGKYIAWGSDNNFRTASATAYKLNLYKRTAVEPTVAQTEFRGTSTNGPLNEDQTNSTFRIPALVTLDNGWIVAASDIRWPNTADSPNNLDTIVSISKDGGKTWDWEIVNYFSDFAPLYGGGQRADSASFIDPALAVDGSGKLWMAVDLQPTHVNLGQNAQKTGSGFDENGLLMVGPISESEWNSKVNTSLGRNEATRLQYQAYYEYRVDINGTRSGTITKNGKEVSLFSVFHKDDNDRTPTGYYVDAFFDLWYDYGEDGGIKPVLVAQKESSALIQANLFYKASPWKAYSTTYLMIRTAEVEGDELVWGEPRLISGVKNFDGETFLAFCPGRGTVITLGSGTERIIFPVYDNVSGEKTSIVYSDDGGATWHRSARVENGNSGKTSESQVVELPVKNADGTPLLRIYSRNTAGYISYADSSDGGATWTPSYQDKALKGGYNVMVSFINLDGCLLGPDGTVYENLILASYPWGTIKDGEHNRSNGVIRIGSIGTGEGNPVTWLNPNEVRYSGRYNYSCLTQLMGEDHKPADGFGLLYETDGGKGMLIPFDTFTTADLLGEGWNWVLEVPSEADIPNVTVTAIEGSKNTHDTDLLDLNAGEMGTITVAVTPESAEVIWSSDDESVATVDENGVVTAVAPGRAIITVAAINKGVTRKTAVEIVVQDDANITLPNRYADGIETAIVEARTQYELEASDTLPDGVYAIFSKGNGARIMYGQPAKTDHCMASPANGVLFITCHAPDLHLWKITRQSDGTYTVQNVNRGKYLTSVADGSQLALSDTAVQFTIVHQGNGSYYVQSGGSYLAWDSGWKMQSDAFDIEFYAETSYEASTTYTTTASGLKVLIEALNRDKADFAEVLALAKPYATEAEATEALTQIDELAKELYRQLRGGQEVGHDHIWSTEWASNGEYHWHICTHEGCDATIDVAEHSWDEGAVTTEPTYTSEGERTYTCTVCGATRTESIDRLIDTPIPVIPSIEPGEPPEEIEDPDTPLGEMPFIDVRHDAWYAQSVANVTSRGYMYGTDVATFSPGMKLNRGAMAQIIYNLAQKPENTGSLTFTDLGSDVQYRDAVAWGAANGILKGYSEEVYGGERDVTREQTAVMLYRYAQLQKLDTEVGADALEQFVDGTEVSGWAKEAMSWAVAKGLFQGRGNGRLDPRATMTRAETAAVLDRFYKLFLA